MFTSKTAKAKKSARRGLLIIQFGAAKWNENTRYSKEKKGEKFPLYHQRWSFEEVTAWQSCEESFVRLICKTLTLKKIKLG